MKASKQAAGIFSKPTVFALPLLLAGALYSAILLSGFAAEPAAFIAHSAGQADTVVSHGGADYFRFGTAVWGPNWAWTGVQGKTQSEQGAVVGTLSAIVGGTTLRLSFRAARTAPNRLELTYELKAEKDADLTLFVVEMAPGEAFNGREVLVESQGKQTPVRSPFAKRAVSEQVNALRWTDAAGGRTLMHFDPPCEMAADGALRIVLAKDHLKADSIRRLTVSVDLPGATDWFSNLNDLPDEPGLATWYPWRATGEAADSVLSMTDWIEKPSGQHRRIKSQSEQLVYDRKPLKL